MKIIFCAAFICLAVASPSIHQVHHFDHPQRIPGEFLVALHAQTGKTTSNYAEIVADKISNISSYISIVRSYTDLRGPIFLVKTTQESAISLLFELEEVDFIQANAAALSIQQCTSQQTKEKLWGLSRVSSRDKPSYASATFKYNVGDGARVKVYVLDSGVRHTHKDFGDRAKFGFNALGDGNNNDVDGHGTHCAGTIAGTQYGIAKAAKIVAVKIARKITDDIKTDVVIDAFLWAINEIKNDKEYRGIISVSASGPLNQAVDRMVNEAFIENIPVVASSGNDGKDACLYSPGNGVGSITVGNTNKDDVQQATSNWGRCVDILAPGTDIVSAYNVDDTDEKSLSGTSMSCPHVSGLVAAYLSKNPTATSAMARSFVVNTATTGKINVGTTGTPNRLMYYSCE